jgi:hypothetical protein
MEQNTKSMYKKMVYKPKIDVKDINKKELMLILEELRSGKHRQGVGCFDSWPKHEQQTCVGGVVMRHYRKRYPGIDITSIRKKLGMSDAQMDRFAGRTEELNNQGKTFNEIADIIEREYLL